MRELRIAGKPDPIACSVAMYYVTIASVPFDSGVWIVPVTPEFQRKGAEITTLANLRELYLAKGSHD